MRHKIPDDMKREKFTVSIDERLYELLENFLKEKGHPNRSRYIENLIEKDMLEKGHDIKKKF